MRSKALFRQVGAFKNMSNPSNFTQVYSDEDVLTLSTISHEFDSKGLNTDVHGVVFYFIIHLWMFLKIWVLGCSRKVRFLFFIFLHVASP